jgi:glycerate kinase
VIVIAGTIGQDARITYEHGIAAFTSILPQPCVLDEAIANAAEWTSACAENVIRTVLVGRRMADRIGHRARARDRAPAAGAGRRLSWAA